MVFHLERHRQESLAQYLNYSTQKGSQQCTEAGNKFNTDSLQTNFEAFFSLP